VPAPISNLAIRPEFRWDNAMNGTHPFNGGQTNNAILLSADVIIAF